MCQKSMIIVSRQAGGNEGQVSGGHETTFTSSMGINSFYCLFNIVRIQSAFRFYLPLQNPKLND